jgi:hypothetical protein
MFPRNVLAASAMGAAMTVSAAKAGSFGNPDQPAEGASGTSRLQKRNRAWRGGGEAPRAQRSRLNDNLVGRRPELHTCERYTNQSQSHTME